MLCGRVGRTLEALERVLMPAACLSCGAPHPRLESEGLVCGLCRSRWRPIPEPVCSRCGQPGPPPWGCRICQDWSGVLLDGVKSAVWLDQEPRLLVHRLKFEGWSRLARSMAAAMAPLEPLTGRVFLVPVPLGAVRYRRRGYNQSELLARELGRIKGRPVATGVLRRVRETRSQTALQPEARRANVAGAFEARSVARKALVLVDDVFTTGATLLAAAAALGAAGAATVSAVTFARAAEPVR